MPARQESPSEPVIALVGIGCRYPGGVVDAETFWRTLRDGVDVISEVPASRWGPEFLSEDGSAPGTGYCRYGGFLPELDGFDADFFGISFREAREMDPQQRLLLEVSWEALEHAGMTKPQLSGSRTGVFFGMLGMDYTLLHSKTRGVTGIDPYFASGKEFSFAAGRVAYTLGLHGPALSVNTACSSSLVAVHLACRALAGGEADVALAGGVNVLVAPELSIFMSKVQALSPTGSCKPFAADADGIVRGEGCGVVVLKRLDDALAAGDQVLALIRGSAMNHDGRSAGLTVPNATAQIALLRETLQRAGATPEQVAYVETHGTGTPLGDPVEAYALSEVFGPGRPEAQPLHIGSHKANFGHTDAAAGVAGLIKTVLTAQHRLVPPQLHLGTPNPAIAWAESPLRIAAEARPLDCAPDALFGVSAFGLSGTNAHLLLSAAPVAEPAVPAPGDEGAPRVLLVSGSTEAALRTRAGDLLRTLEGLEATQNTEQPEGQEAPEIPEPASPVRLADILHTAAVRRTHHEHRAALLGTDAAGLRESLRALAADEADEHTFTGRAEPRRRHHTVFVFSGQGSQWQGMGLDLWERDPVAAAVLDECDRLLTGAGFHPLRALLGELDLSATELAQPALLAVQAAVAAVWRSRGLEPSLFLGHSVGEIAAAHAAGALDLPTALDLAVRRGRITAQAAGSGRMLAVPLSEEDAAQAIQGMSLHIAAVNGPTSVVLAGAAADIREAVRIFAEHSVNCRLVPGDYAFHSPAMAPYAALLGAELDGVLTASPAPAFRSTVFPDEPPELLDAAYWAANVLRPVRFWPAVQRILNSGGADFIEIGPHPTLVRPLTAGLVARRRQGIAVPSLRRDGDGPATLLAALAELHCAGATVRWDGLLPGRATDLPGHAWQHESFWLPDVQPGVQSLPGVAGTAHGAVPALLSIQPLDSEGRPVGPVQHIDMTVPLPGGTDGLAQAPVATPLPTTGPSPALTPPPVGAARENAAPVPAPAAPPAAEPGTGGSTPAPGRKALLRQVSEVLAWVLGQDSDRRIPAQRGFADLGMDSITVVEFADRLEVVLGVEVPVSTPFEHPCLDELVDFLLPLVTAKAEADAAATAAAAPAVPGAGAAASGEAAAAQDALVPLVTAAAPEAPGAPESPGTLESPGVASPEDDPVAVVGLGCRFPGGATVPDYWRLLTDGREVIRDVPGDRWDGTAFLSEGEWAPGTMSSLRGGYLDDVRGFDAAFFRVSPREARSLDPQHRLFLEVAYEALADSGTPPEQLRGSATGVFVGMNSSDHAQIVGSRLQDVDLYYGTGNSFAGAAGRLSYFLGLTGPSMAVDSACSSSLTAVHLACQSLLSGESEIAVAGGVNVILSPVIPIAVSAGGALSPSGRCRTFDDAADGYLRGEGAGVVVLKRLSRALADGDRVYAVLPGTAVNQDGASSGLTVPNGTAQRELIQRALNQAGLTGADVGYVEAHGTGTPLGDPIELRALAQVCRPDPAAAEGPLLVGSVKPNVGHLEAAAGVAGLIKAVLSVHHGRLAPHIGVETPTRQIDWQRLGLALAGDEEQWPRPERRRIAGVSAFGFTGTNAHVLVAQAPDRAAATERPEPPARYVLPLSAAHPAALPAAAANQLAALPDPTSPGSTGSGSAGAGTDGAALADLGYTTAARRGHLEHRAVAVGRDLASLRAALQAGAEGRQHPGLRTGTAEFPRGTVFVFSGFGSQWVGMGRQLLREEPVFADAVLRCEEEMRKWIAWSPLASLRGEPDSRPFDEGVPQELIFTVQVGLVELWRSWGVRPDAVVGHSMGEVAAAWTAGALTLAQAAEVLCLRSRLLDTLTGTGGSLAVGLSPQALAPYLVLYEDQLGIATVNGPRTTVVSGALEALEELAQELVEENIFVRRVKVPVAAHSPLMEPLRERLVEGLAALVPAPTRIPLHSSVEGHEVPGQALTAEYWGRNLRNAVLFQAAVTSVEDPAERAFVEVSPHPVLVASIEESLVAAGVEEPVALPSLVRDEDEVESLLGTLATLQAHGVPVDWNAFYGPGRSVVDVPGYPWQRIEYRLADAEPEAPAAGGALVGPPVRPAYAPEVALLPVHVDGVRNPWQVARPGAGAPVTPAALLEAALRAVAQTASATPSLREVRFGPAARTGADGRAALQAAVRPREGTLALYPQDGWDTPGLTAALDRFPQPAAGVPPVDGIRDEALRDRLADRFPALLVRRVETGADGVEVTVTLPASACRYRMPADLLRLALQLVADTRPGESSPPEPQPQSIGLVRVRAAVDGTVRVRRGALRLGADGLAEADLVVLDPAGRPVLELDALRLTAVQAPAGDEDAEDRVAGLCYQMVRRPQQPLPAATDGDATKRWLVCGDTGHLAGALAGRLAELGLDVVRVRSLDAGGAPAEAELTDGQPIAADRRIDPVDRDAWRALLADYADGVPTGIVSLWPLEDLDPRPGAWRSSAALAGALAGSEGAVPRLWLVTRNAVLTQGHGGYPDGLQGTHAGIGRVLSMERPDAWGGHVDLSCGSSEEVAALATWLSRGPGPEHVRLEHTAAEAASMVRVALPERNAAELPRLPADRWYLVTGAGGELAAPSVDWLLDSGARRIALLDSGTGSGTVDSPAGDRQTEWRGRGAELLPATVDGLDALLTRLRADGGLAGVVCATPPGPARPLEQLDEQQVGAALRRAELAEELHTATLADPLELFVLLGSTPGAWGGSGAGAAAPADWLLRALAARRKASGLPVTHLELMPVEGAELLDERTTRLLAGSGVNALRPTDVTAALARVHGTGAVHVAVADVDWEVFGSALAGSAHRRLFAEVLDGRAVHADGGRFAAQLGDLDPVRRRDLMLDWVCAQAATVLGLPEDGLQPRQGFFELGMDSVMALALRLRLARELDLTLSATVAFEYPTASALTDHLLALLGHGPAAPDEAGAEAAPAAPGGDDLDDLDDDELLRQLDAEISGSQDFGHEENR
ncbi:beta-ketoacyl synthase N-terminal-like domain-containing protein [Streptacidiphilus sp. EB129]|uniref:type I polyketide synthase n=1 Tax=Streptacidiphilus sp. EB129 TaxID=3156262 RepID=UPI00351271DE